MNCRESIRYRGVAWVLKTMLSLRYKVTTQFSGSSREAILDKSTGTLLILNHPTWGIEASKVFSEIALLGVKPVIVIAEGQLQNPILGTAAKLFDVVVIPDMTQKGGDMQVLKSAIDRVKAALNEGRLIAIAGAGRIYRSRFETMGSMAAQILDSKPNARVVTAYADGLWGSRFSYAGTGEYPQILPLIRAGILSTIANFGFNPKHPWTLTFEEQTERLRGKTPAQINEALKEIFNTTERGINHPRPAVRYRLGWWDSTIPVPDPVISQLAGDIHAVPDDVRKATVDKLVEITKDQSLRDLALDSPQLLSKHLRDELGMDSLATAEFIVWVEEYTAARTGTRFQVTNTENLTTVQDAMLAAHGAAKVEGGSKMQLPSPEWLAEPGTEPVRYHWDGKAFAHRWLEKALRHPNHAIIADPMLGSLPQRKLLQILHVLLPEFEKIPGERVGVLLPSGIPAFMAIQALRLAGKVPVLLNFTTGVEAVRNAVRMTGIKHVFTSSVMMGRTGWSDAEIQSLGVNWVYFESIRQSLTALNKIGVALSSYTGAARKYLDRKLSNDAAILVTSGSEGMPKSILITEDMLGIFIQHLLPYYPSLREGDRLLQTGPPFHVLGLIAGVVLPSVTSIKVGLLPNPTDYKTLATFAELYRTGKMVSPPAFADGMAVTSLPGQLDDLSLLVYGAQAMTRAQRASIEARAGNVRIREGYGATETTGGLMFEHENSSDGEDGWMQMLACVDYKVLDLETQSREVAPGEMGVLFVRGPTVITSYLPAADPALDKPSSAFVNIGGKEYFRTGDLMRTHPTRPGFFRYETRVSRTYKDKAGEFINPDSIQEALSSAFVRTDTDAPGPMFAVTGATQPEGYKLTVLFTTRPLTVEAANQAIFAQGLSPVFKVAKVYHVNKIPLAGSGKVALSTIDRWAREMENPNPQSRSEDLKQALSF